MTTDTFTTEDQLFLDHMNNKAVWSMFGRDDEFEEILAAREVPQEESDDLEAYHDNYMESMIEDEEMLEAAMLLHAEKRTNRKYMAAMKYQSKEKGKFLAMRLSRKSLMDLKPMASIQIENLILSEVISEAKVHEYEIAQVKIDYIKEIRTSFTSWKAQKVGPATLEDQGIFLPSNKPTHLKFQSRRNKVTDWQGRSTLLITEIRKDNILDMEVLKRPDLEKVKIRTGYDHVWRSVNSRDDLNVIFYGRQLNLSSRKGIIFSNGKVINGEKDDWNKRDRNILGKQLSKIANSWDSLEDYYISKGYWYGYDYGELNEYGECDSYEDMLSEYPQYYPDVYIEKVVGSDLVFGFDHIGGIDSKSTDIEVQDALIPEGDDFYDYCHEDIRFQDNW